MSKCGVLRRLKWNVWYWTLLRPKYCAAAVDGRLKANPIASVAAIVRALLPAMRTLGTSASPEDGVVCRCPACIAAASDRIPTQRASPFEDAERDRPGRRRDALLSFGVHFHPQPAARSVVADRVLFLVSYLLFWTAAFLVARGIFIVYEHHAAAQLGIGTIGRVFLNGARMDLSAAAYATIVPSLLIILGRVVRPSVVRAALTTYTYALVVVVTLFTAADLGIYDAWGVRLDA